jgi:histidinol-phosphatase (PHP family)
MTKIDYHTHHDRCGHATGSLREYIESAIEQGLDQIGLADHLPLIHIPAERMPEGTAMDISLYDGYVSEALDLKKAYERDIDVRVGVEGYFVTGWEKELAELINPYPFDFVIGSIHNIGEWDISDSRQRYLWEGRDVNQVYRDYYGEVKASAESGLFDFVGHFDVIKKHGLPPTEDLWSDIEAALMAVKRADMAMELNVSGIDKAGGEMYPAESIVRRALELGIPFTLSSDAHQPEHVYRFVSDGREFLKQLGLTEVATFKNRQRIMLPIK